MEAQGSSLQDIALLISTGVNAIHLFNDGNGRTSRLLNYLINTDYTGSEDQVVFLKKLLGENGRLFIDINPKDAIESYILYNQLNIDPESVDYPKGIHQVGLAGVI